MYQPVTARRVSRDPAVAGVERVDDAASSDREAPRTGELARPRSFSTAAPAELARRIEPTDVERRAVEHEDVAVDVDGDIGDHPEGLVISTVQDANASDRLQPRRGLPHAGSDYRRHQHTRDYPACSDTDRLGGCVPRPIGNPFLRS